MKKIIILLSVLVLILPSFTQAIENTEQNESLVDTVEVDKQNSENLIMEEESVDSNVPVNDENRDEYIKEMGNSKNDQEENKSDENTEYQIVEPNNQLVPDNQEEDQVKASQVKKIEAVESTLLTADEMYEIALNQSSSSATLQAFISGYNVYPNDDRFSQGINESARSLLDWASVQHQQELKIDTARVRYEFILTAPSLDEVISKETEFKLSYARQEKIILSANKLFELAKSEVNSSPSLSKYIEGHYFYPLDQRFIEGIESSSRDLLDWTSNQHALGNIDTARVRYELILSSPKIDQKLSEEIELKYQLAVQRKRIPSSDELVKMANRQKNSSAMLNAFIEAYKFYPRDKRITNGINNSAQFLFDWASIQHELGDLDTARLRYELILSTPVLNEDLKHATEQNLESARQGIVIINPATLLAKANDEQNSSAKLTAFIDGYYLFPDDKRFIDGINASAKGLLDWATGKHSTGNIDTARVRYLLILSAPALNNGIKKEIELKMDYVLQNKTLPSVEKLIKEADAEVNSSPKLEIYIKGLLLYSSNASLKDGLNKSARELLDWATIKHAEGHLMTAKLRYELILSSPGLNSTIKSETESRLLLANKGTLLPTANMLFEIANNETNSSERLIKFGSGYNFFPNDRRFIDGANETALSLLNWVIEQHQTGNYGTAIHRYNLIINTQGIKSNLIKNARNNLTLAQKGAKPIAIKKIVNAKVQNYTYAQMQNDINKLELMYPGLISQEVIGKSLDGKNIYAVKLGAGKTEVLFNGSAHAREHMTTNVLMKMIDEYAYAYSKGLNCDGFNVREVLNRTTIWFIPMTNPDGVSLVQLGPNSLGSNVAKRAIEINGGSRNFTSWKANARGVDLNRNYPTMWRTVANDPGRPSESHYKGPTPLSEPESQTIYKFILTKNFKTLVDYHSSGEVLYARLPGHIERIVSQKTGYRIIDETNFTSGGDLPTWFTLELGMPGLTPEISYYVGPKPVPVANWDSIWRKNHSVGLIVADEAYRNRRIN